MANSLSASWRAYMENADSLLDGYRTAVLNRDAFAARGGSLPPFPLRLAAALRDSQLPAGTANAVLATLGSNDGLLPDTGQNGGAGSNGGGGGSGNDGGGGGGGSNGGGAASGAAAQQGTTGAAARLAPWHSARALALLQSTAVHLHDCTGTGAVEANAAIGSALAHPDVTALRLALLQTLWEQAGLGPAGAGPDAAAGPGASDAAPSPGGDLLWIHYQSVIVGAVGLWQAGRERVLISPDEGRLLPPEPGVPPELQLARAAARTAEAMARLMRGQGLGGVFGAEQLRRLVVEENNIVTLLPLLSQRCPPVPEPLPHWAEASAWVLAAALEGLEAALAAGQGAGAGANAAGASAAAAAAACDLAAKVAMALERAAVTAAGLLGSGASAQRMEALAARLRRAGLGASLDHALRLAFAFRDRAMAPGFSREAVQLDLGFVGVLDQVSVLNTALAPAALHDATPVSRSEAAASAAEGLAECSGLALTLAKWASLLARRMEAAAAAAPGNPAGAATRTYLQGTGDSNARRLLILLLKWATLLRMRREGSPGTGVRGAAAEPATPAASHGPSSARPPTAGRAVAEEEQEAYFYLSTARLVSQLGADMAAAPHAPAAGPGAQQQLSPPALVRLTASAALAECLHYVGSLCADADVSLAAEGRILACQPHRLLAAATKLVVAWRSDGVAAQELAQRGALNKALCLAALRLAANPALAARMRRWLLPPAAARGGARAGAGSAAEGLRAAEAEAGALEGAVEGEEPGWEAERGCLEQAWRELWRSFTSGAEGEGGYPPLAGPKLLSSLALWRSDGGGPGGGERVSVEIADAAFRSGAIALLGDSRDLQAGVPQGHAFRLRLLRVPQDTRGAEALMAAMAATAELAGGTSPLPAEAEAAAEAVLAAPLPPPLAVPPEGRALTKLRVCGCPGCGSFGARSETALPLRQCSACKAVRYCGPGCQRAHWRDGHRAECGALAGAVAALAAARESE
ncbi:hypothetical protein HYH03_002811 [Edaphochlamys debaryana]|uniref:MYND-type domain-containing protein n=1 Tax=Edaphochlamys debaryana TaxID=47281 RepID=A0A835YAB4_9CHLO|nr:hypothetical protein HYH03_002811 [Edaphochlamys debaryana]|eukprot:KAG2499232.1 hypothetical protein HYH03_002811 [Edaphochlamys debaryana]